MTSAREAGSWIVFKSSFVAYSYVLPPLKSEARFLSVKSPALVQHALSKMAAGMVTPQTVPKPRTKVQTPEDNQTFV